MAYTLTQLWLHANPHIDADTTQLEELAQHGSGTRAAFARRNKIAANKIGAHAAMASRKAAQVLEKAQAAREKAQAGREARAMSKPPPPPPPPPKEGLGLGGLWRAVASRRRRRRLRRRAARAMDPTRLWTLEARASRPVDRPQRRRAAGCSRCARRVARRRPRPRRMRRRS